MQTTQVGHAANANVWGSKNRDLTVDYTIVAGKLHGSYRNINLRAEVSA
jgi:hypothetical protein